MKKEHKYFLLSNFSFQNKYKKFEFFIYVFLLQTISGTCGLA